jgi:hypothetical protein
VDRRLGGLRIASRLWKVEGRERMSVTLKRISAEFFGLANAIQTSA